MAAKKKAAKQAAKKKAAPARRKPVVRKQPETLRIKSLGVGLTLSDITRSLDFYTRILGFHPGDKWEKDGQLMGQEIKAGTTAFWINQDDWSKGRDRVKGVGMRLYCNTTQDVAMLAAGIKQRGGTLDHEPVKQSWGTMDFGVTDPDGYKITIQSM